RPDEVDERDAQMPAVEVAGEIEEMNLELDPGAAHGGPAAEIGYPVAPARAAALIDAGLHGVDAECRLQIAAQAQIGGGETEQPAAPVAGLDPALDLPGPAEQAGRCGRIARAEPLAHLGRGIDHPGTVGGGGHRGDAEAGPSAEIGQ